MNDIRVNERKIKIGNKKIELRYPVKMVELIDNMYIILLGVPIRAKLGFEEFNNIVCYNNKGELVWKIDDKLPGGIVSNEQTPYVAIQIQDNILKATDFFGRRFQIDVTNGKLLCYEVVR